VRPRSLPARSRHELLRAREVRGVHHLALERERIDAAPSVLLEQRDELARLVDRFLRRREHLVDHGNLVGMDRDLAGETLATPSSHSRLRRPRSAMSVKTVSIASTPQAAATTEHMTRA